MFLSQVHQWNFQIYACSCANKISELVLFFFCEYYEFSNNSIIHDCKILKSNNPQISINKNSPSQKERAVKFRIKQQANYLLSSVFLASWIASRIS